MQDPVIHTCNVDFVNANKSEQVPMCHTANQTVPCILQFVLFDHLASRCIIDSSCPDGSTVRRDVQVSTRVHPRNFAQRAKHRCTKRTKGAAAMRLYKKQETRTQHPDTGNRRQEREKAAETTYSYERERRLHSARFQKPAAFGGQKRRRPAHCCTGPAAAGTAPRTLAGRRTNTSHVRHLLQFKIVF